MKSSLKRYKVKKIYWIVATVALLVMLLPGCGGAGKAIPTYKVNETTGLYAAFGDINAEQIAILPTGTILIPADDETKLFCDSFTEGGMPYVLCKVEVSDTGQTGWVLKLFIEKN